MKFIIYLFIVYSQNGALFARLCQCKVSAFKHATQQQRHIQLLLLFIIYLYLKRTAHLAINASLSCVPLKHIYIYSQVKHMIKHRKS